MADETSNITTLEVAGEWTNESGITGPHDSLCMVTIAANDVSGELSFNFSSVDGTINGIEIMLHYAVGDADDFVHVELYDSTSTWRLKIVAWPAQGVCTGSIDRTVGASDDLWGGIWTAAHIKSSSFRIRVTSKATGKAGGTWSCDYGTCKVYYTEAGGEQAVIFQMG